VRSLSSYHSVVGISSKEFALHLSSAHSASLRLLSAGISIRVKMSDLGNLSLRERKIIVGIDFGTTYSGLAWAETRRVRIITATW
jgi:hypothetical protein